MVKQSPKGRPGFINKSAKDDDNSVALSFSKWAQIRSGPQALVTSNELSRSKTSEEIVWIESRKTMELERSDSSEIDCKENLSSVVNIELK